MQHLLLQADARHEEILGHLLYAAKIVAEKEGIVDGFRVVINSGPSACKLLSCEQFLSWFCLSCFLTFWYHIAHLLLIMTRSICISSALACPRWETDELATRLKVEYNMAVESSSPCLLFLPFPMLPQHRSFF